MNTQTILKVENVKKSFPGTMALKGVSLEIEKGEIHAIVGENGAGKSTLMNIISGVLTADEGEIYIDGKKIDFFKTPLEAQLNGIGFVHQELALCPHVTVGDNVFIGRLPEKNGAVDRKQLYEKTAEVLAPFKSNIKPDQKVSELSVAQQQVVEIARALSLKCKVVILDEPTSSLNESEAQRLFEIINDIKSKGISVIYISHKLSEIFQICDRITIFRDGKYISTRDTKDVTPENIVNEMVGRSLGNLYPDKSQNISEEIFRVENFTNLPHFNNVSFSLRKGEILGLCGLVGSGRTEVARAICGIDKRKSGNVFMEGKEVKINNYKDALDKKLCYMSEDRKLDGLFLQMSIADNMMAPQISEISKYGLVDRKSCIELTLKYKEQLNVKFSAPLQSINSLSGGNQQKIMIAKLLAIHPKVIILDEPTRGIDVGAKSEIHFMLRELSEKGICIIVISSEMPEIVGVCDKVIVMREGSAIGELEGADLTEDNIIASISGNMVQSAV